MIIPQSKDKVSYVRGHCHCASSVIEHLTSYIYRLRIITILISFNNLFYFILFLSHQPINHTQFLYSQFEIKMSEKPGDKLSLEQGQYVMERRLKELRLVVSPSQKSTPRDGNCLPESLFDQAQYVPELAGLVDDAFELRVQVVLSLEDYVKQGSLIWPGGDETTENEEDFGTQKQWKQKMLRPGTFVRRCCVPQTSFSLPRS